MPAKEGQMAKEWIAVLRAADAAARWHVHQRRDFTFGHTRHVWAPSAGFVIIADHLG